jgi:hypothetical protein
MAFQWDEPVYFTPYNDTSVNPSFPSEFQERLGWIVGIADHNGESLTYHVLDLVIKQVVVRSELRLENDSTTPSLRNPGP